MSKTRYKVLPVQGMAADLPAYMLGQNLWSGGANIAFRPFAERSGSYASVYGSPTVKMRSLMNAVVGGVNYWLYNVVNKSWAVTGTTHSDITKGAGTLSSVTRANQWSVGVFNGFPIANNGTDTPMYWDGDVTHDFLEVPGWPAGSVAATVRTFGNFIFALNLSTAGGNFPDQVKWSSAAAAGAMPTTWAASATNDAGSLQLSDTAGGIIDGAPLGNGLAVYKAREAYMLEYRPDNFVFQQRILPIRRGVLARNCIAGYRGRHFLVTADGDAILTDGTGYESVLENRMQRYIFNQLDQSTFDAVFVAQYRKRSEIWICFPSSGSSFCDIAAVWNYKDNTWGVRDLPLISCAAAGIVSDTAPAENWDADGGTWDSDTTVWNEQAAVVAEEKLLLGQPNDAGANSAMLEVDKGQTANGSAITARVSKYSMDLGDPTRVKLVRGVYPYVNADPGVQLSVRVGSQMEPAGAITWSPSVTYTVGSGQRADCFAVGKYISVEFSSTANAAWQLPAFDLEYDPRGYF
jgi:hypothetical protein